MLCEDCNEDYPLTYRSFRLKKKSVCAPCIRKNYPDSLTFDSDFRDSSMIPRSDELKYGIFLSSVKSLKKEHKDCDPIGCPWRSIGEDDVRALWDALMVSGLRVSLEKDDK